MATESDLRDLLRGPEPEGPTAIDLESVLRRSRARRRPRLIAASTVGAFALAAVLTPVVVLSLPATQSSLFSAQDSGGAAEAPTSGESDTALTEIPSAATLNACAAPVAAIPSTPGLVLEVAPVTAAAGADSIPAEVTLRNDGTGRVAGVTGASPVMTLAADGIVLWHSHGATDAIGVPVDLAPGESMTFAAEFEPVVCGPADDADGFRADLPAVGAGSYTLSAAIDLYPDDATAGPLLVTGPAAPVHLTE